ncbi:MAG: phytoene/squalene synthase family protein [Bacteroidetes bacterium]|nr:phytoene/squalene synthase family protein [Bacteroidota bacterium]
MKSIFDEVSRVCSKVTTRAYSTSFSMGIFFLDPKLHPPIYSIYGFVRFADEIVDSFDGFDKKYLLDKFKKDTYEAIEQKISLNPIINAYQEVVNKYNIEMELTDTFFRSMEMDLHKNDYDKSRYEQYIFGSAEVVGLMCLRVFIQGNSEAYEKLKPSAMKLGAAFQKVNFLRDIKQDYEQLGRTYFPGVNLDALSASEKLKIEEEIEEDFKLALVGIGQLPTSSRMGVYLAYYYYKNLLKKIKKVPPKRIMNDRIGINNTLKLFLLLKSYLRYQMNLL